MYYIEKNNGIGSSDAMFITNIKTIKGCLNRVKNLIPSWHNVDVRIYQYTNVYDNKSYKLIKTVNYK